MAATLEALGIDRLSVRERLDLIDEIWDSLPDEMSADDIPTWHIPILERRLADATANPGVGTPWREALARIRSGS